MSFLDKIIRLVYALLKSIQNILMVYFMHWVYLCISLLHIVFLYEFKAVLQYIPFLVIIAERLAYGVLPQFIK